MPRKKPLHRYPIEYYALFERTQLSSFTLYFDSAQRASSIRSDLYNLRAATREAITLDPNNEVLAEQYLLMENVVIEAKDNALHFRTRHYTNQTHIASATLGAPNAPTTTAKLEEAFISSTEIAKRS